VSAMDQLSARFVNVNVCRSILMFINAECKSGSERLLAVLVLCVIFVEMYVCVCVCVCVRACACVCVCVCVVGEYLIMVL
jgi:hypothetical protein